MSKAPDSTNPAPAQKELQAKGSELSADMVKSLKNVAHPRKGRRMQRLWPSRLSMVMYRGHHSHGTASSNIPQASREQWVSSQYHCTYFLLCSSESLSICWSLGIVQQGGNNILSAAWVEPEAMPWQGFKATTANKHFFFNYTEMSSAMFIYWKYPEWLYSVTSNFFFLQWEMMKAERKSKIDAKPR